MIVEKFHRLFIKLYSNINNDNLYLYIATSQKRKITRLNA